MTRQTTTRSHGCRIVSRGSDPGRQPSPQGRTGTLLTAGASPARRPRPLDGAVGTRRATSDVAYTRSAMPSDARTPNRRGEAAVGAGGPHPSLCPYRWEVTKIVTLGRAPQTAQESADAYEVTKSKNSTTRVDVSQASQPGAQVDNRCQAGESWEARRIWPHSSAGRASMAHDPTAQARPLVHRWLVGLLLGLVLISSGLACAPQFVGPTAAGYVFALDVPTSIIFLGEAAELIVSVRNAQGQLVDGIPVFFQVEPTWAQSASVSPQVASTQRGTARALFRARTTGVVHITVRGDNASQETRITVTSRPSHQASRTPGDYYTEGAALRIQIGGAGERSRIPACIDVTPPAGRFRSSSREAIKRVAQTGLSTMTERIEQCINARGECYAQATT